MEHGSFGLEVGFIESLGVRVVGVGDDEGWRRRMIRIMREKRGDNIQLSLKARVVKASQTETMLGCRIRLHVSIAVNAA